MKIWKSVEKIKTLLDFKIQENADIEAAIFCD